MQCGQGYKSVCKCTHAHTFPGSLYSWNWLESWGQWEMKRNLSPAIWDLSIGKTFPHPRNQTFSILVSHDSLRAFTKCHFSQAAPETNQLESSWAVGLRTTDVSQPMLCPLPRVQPGSGGRRGLRAQGARLASLPPFPSRRNFIFHQGSVLLLLLLFSA